MFRLRWLPGLLLVSIAVLGSLALPPALPAASEVRNVAGIEGLPLMPGLREKPAERVNFDTPGGRIIEAFAAGSVTVAKITTFYKATLPQLGWRPVGDLAFEREGEKLIIDFPSTQATGNDQQVGPAESQTVRFAISPHQ